jgi:tetratricopeptide (TPR) repeat protein
LGKDFGIWDLSFGISGSSGLGDIMRFLQLFTFIVFVPALSFAQEQAQQEEKPIVDQGVLQFVGEKYTRTLSPDTIHVWNLALEKGRYVEVEVVQQGIDVVVRVLDPAGLQKGEFDSPTGASGMEKAVWITSTGGAWQVHIAPFEGSQSGSYAIKWTQQREATQNDRQLWVADSLRSLAKEHETQQNYVDAEKNFQQALSIREKVLGAEHLLVAQILNNLAGLFEAQARYVEAESLNLRALTIRENNLGPEHPDVAESLNNLALFYYNQALYDKAEPIFKRTLAIREKILGPDHPVVAKSLHNLADLLLAQKKYTEAELFNRRALAIFDKILGPNHSNVAQTLKNLARCIYFADVKNTESALSQLYRAISIWNTTKGDPRWRISAYDFRSQLRKQKGDLQGALSDLAIALDSAEKLRLQSGSPVVVKKYAPIFSKIMQIHTIGS